MIFETTYTVFVFSKAIYRLDLIAMIAALLRQIGGMSFLGCSGRATSFL